MASPISVIIDSSCSLPKKVVEKYNIKLVPLNISIDDQTMLDPCCDGKTLDLFHSGKLSRKHKVSTMPPTVEEFKQAIEKEVESGSKMIVVQTVNRNQGETYSNANVAASEVKRNLKPASNIIIRVMDSRTVFAGQGLMATETIRRILSGQDPADVRRSMDVLSTKIHTYVLPKEPLLALERAQKRNEKAVGWTQVFIANTLGIHPTLCIVNDSSYLATKAFGFKKSAKHLFDHARRQIEKGLLSPLVAINFGGSLSELKALPGYAELKQVATKNKVQLIPSVMSIAGGIYTSVGSLSLAMACEPTEFAA